MLMMIRMISALKVIFLLARKSQQFYAHVLFVKNNIPRLKYLLRLRNDLPDQFVLVICHILYVFESVTYFYYILHMQ